MGTESVPQRPIDGTGLRIALVCSAFNGEITAGLLEGAREVCRRARVAACDEFEAPGSFELPLFAQRLAAAGYHAIVALGAVIEGETDHYEHVAHRASEGLMRVMLDTGVPVAFGVLTVRNPEHARLRSKSGPGNKGAEAAAAALASAQALRAIERR